MHTLFKFKVDLTNFLKFIASACAKRSQWRSIFLQQDFIFNQFIFILELCELKCRPVEKYVSIEGETNKNLTVRDQDSYADHPLVVGPRYIPNDVRVTWATHLGKFTSGVMRKYEDS